MLIIEKTDWTRYYHKKKSWFSTYTQKFTLRMILEYCDQIKILNNADIIELGGGNSCFADELCAKCKINSYDIVDNNEFSVGLFKQKKIPNSSHGYVKDLTKSVKIQKQYHFVFSIGLIEHFTPEQRTKVIENHFAYCKNNGYVLISFPTPTLKYRFWRKCMEILHVWQFGDESPIMLEDIHDELKKYGEIIRTDLNNKLFLTQRLVLIHKCRSEMEG